MGNNVDIQHIETIVEENEPAQETVAATPFATADPNPDFSNTFYNLADDVMVIELNGVEYLIPKPGASPTSMIVHGLQELGYYLPADDTEENIESIIALQEIIDDFFKANQGLEAQSTQEYCLYPGFQIEEKDGLSGVLEHFEDAPIVWQDDISQDTQNALNITIPIGFKAYGARHIMVDIYKIEGEERSYKGTLEYDVGISCLSQLFDDPARYTEQELAGKLKDPGLELELELTLSEHRYGIGQNTYELDIREEGYETQTITISSYNAAPVSTPYVQQNPGSNNTNPGATQPAPTDSDGDGVPDSEDACPTQPGPNKGCPDDPIGD